MPALGPPGALTPSQWGARVDYDQWSDLFSPDDGVALHHGGGSDYPAGRTPYTVTREKAQLQSWESHHIDNKGWRGLAYGWGIGQTGTIYRIRGWATYGAHTGDVDGDGIANNSEIVPVLFIGSGNHHDLSPAAQASIETLRRFIEEGSPQATRLYGHREISPATGTTCPGPKGMAYVTAHRTLEEDMSVHGPENWDAADWAAYDERAGKAAWAGGYTIQGRHPNTVLRNIESMIGVLDSEGVSEAELDERVNRLIEIIPDRTRAALKAAL